MCSVYYVICVVCIVYSADFLFCSIYFFCTVQCVLCSVYLFLMSTVYMVV